MVLPELLGCVFAGNPGKDYKIKSKSTIVDNQRNSRNRGNAHSFDRQDARSGIL